MLAAEQLQPPLEITEPIFISPTDEKMCSAYVRALREQHLAQEPFTRALLKDFVLDPRVTKCPEDALGAADLGDENYSMRASTIDLGAIGGVDEQITSLLTLIGRIREGEPIYHYESVTPFRKRAGFNNGKDIPALTASAQVNEDGVSELRLSRTLVRPRIFPLNPVGNIRKLTEYGICARAARLYASMQPRPSSLPQFTKPIEKIEPSDVVYTYAHFGNMVINTIVQESGVPVIVDIGTERTHKRKIKIYTPLPDAPPEATRHVRYFVPCRSVISGFNHLLIAELLSTGSTSVTLEDSRVFSDWVNNISERNRRIHQAAEKVASQNEHGVTE